MTAERKGKDRKIEEKLSASPHRFLEEVKTTMKLREDNRVIIHIWTSSENRIVPGANVGHAALETPHRYISLWPGRRINREPKIGEILRRSWDRYFEVRPPSWKASYLEDCVAEGLSEEHYREIGRIKECRENEEIMAILPEGNLKLLRRGEEAPAGARLVAVTPLSANVRIALYGLNVGEIHTVFDKLSVHCPGWCLVGSNFLTRLRGASGENCASLVYQMLDAGGMYKGMLKIKGSADTSSLTTPDKLIPHILQAKSKEQALHPETREWHFEGESNFLELQRAYGNQSSTAISHPTSSNLATQPPGVPDSRGRLRSRL